MIIGPYDALSNYDWPLKKRNETPKFQLNVASVNINYTTYRIGLIYTIPRGEYNLLLVEYCYTIYPSIGSQYIYIYNI